MNDNFRNAMSANGILAEGSTLPSNNKNWKQNMMNAFTPTGVKIVGVSSNSSSSIQVSEFPTANYENNGRILQYIGQTNSTYTMGYFYECKQTTVNVAATLSFTTSGTAGLGTVTGDVDTFGDKVDNFQDDYEFQYNADVETIKLDDTSASEPYTAQRDRLCDEGGFYAYSVPNGGTLYTKEKTPGYGTTFYTQPEENDDYVSSAWFEEILTYSTEYGKWQLVVLDDLEDINITEYGIEYNGIARIGAKITATYTPAVEGSSTYVWQQINVQPEL